MNYNTSVHAYDQVSTREEARRSNLEAWAQHKAARLQREHDQQQDSAKVDQQAK